MQVYTNPPLTHTGLAKDPMHKLQSRSSLKLMTCLLGIQNNFNMLLLGSQRYGAGGPVHGMTNSSRTASGSILNVPELGMVRGGHFTIVRCVYRGRLFEGFGLKTGSTCPQEVHDFLVAHHGEGRLLRLPRLAQTQLDFVQRDHHILQPVVAYTCTERVQFADQVNLFILHEETHRAVKAIVRERGGRAASHDMH